MVLSSFISSILVLSIGIWAFFKLETTMNLFAERQLLIEPSKFSYKMWKDMPVSMYQSFTFFNLTNWQQVKAIGQKPRFVEVGPYVYKTQWTKNDIQFLNEDQQVSFSERKQWHFQQHLSRGFEDDQIWTINTPLMTALALIQNAPVITRNIVSVILDGLGEGAFIRRPIKSLLFEGYADLIVSVGPLFDRRFSNFNGKFAYLYNKNDSTDGTWTISTGLNDINELNKVLRYSSAIYNMTTSTSGQTPQGLNEVKSECASVWSLDKATNGQLFTPFNEAKFLQELENHSNKNLNQDDDSIYNDYNERARRHSKPTAATTTTTIPQETSARIAAKIQADFRFQQRDNKPQALANNKQLVPNNSLINNNNNNDSKATISSIINIDNNHQDDLLITQESTTTTTKTTEAAKNLLQFPDQTKFIFYPDLCRPLQLIANRNIITNKQGIRAHRYTINPQMFMNSTQLPANKCFEMNPRPPLANALAATLNSVTGANVANLPSLVTGASSPFSSIFNPDSSHNNYNHQQHSHSNANLHQQHLHSDRFTPSGGIFERANQPSSFLNNAISTLVANGAPLLSPLSSGVSSSSSSSNHNGQMNPDGPMARLGRVRQLFTNIVSQRMSSNPAGSGGGAGSLLQGTSALLSGHNPFVARQQSQNSNNNPGSIESRARRDDLTSSASNPIFSSQNFLRRNPFSPLFGDNIATSSSQINPTTSLTEQQQQQTSHSERWITQFRFKWPRGVFSLGQCQLGAPIYASLPHFLDADEYYLEQVDGLKPNRSLHEFYIDIESSLHSIPIGAKARMQLNVATPELRFRNIPNAMIPVLWQELTFEIDKPVARMLYWSVTMASTLYTGLACLFLTSGLLLLASSIWTFAVSKINSSRSSMKSSGLTIDCHENKSQDLQVSSDLSDSSSEMQDSASNSGALNKAFCASQSTLDQATTTTSSSKTTPKQ